MNEKPDEIFEPYVKKLLDSGMKTAEDVAKFIETQAPELGKEIITWGSVSEIIAPVVGLLLITFAVWFHKKFNQADWYTDRDVPPGVFLTIIAGSVGSIVFFAQIMDVLYPIVAPRLYILEKAAALIK
jgi:uncharacterized membrane protein